MDIPRAARDDAIAKAYEALRRSTLAGEDVDAELMRAQVYAALAGVHHAVALDEDCGCDDEGS